MSTSTTALPRRVSGGGVVTVTPGSAGGELCERRVDRVVQPEGAGEASHLEHALHTRAWRRENQRPATMPGAPEAVEQRAQARGVDEADAGQVNHDLPIARSERAGQALREAWHGKCVELALDLQHEGGAGGRVG